MTQIGIYQSQDPTKVVAYTQWAGQQPDNVLNYLNNDSWAAFASSVPWQVQRWQHVGISSIWSVPLTVWGTSLEQVATGAYDNYFHAAAQALAQTMPSKDGNIYIRLGWEFNGGWMPWAAQGHEAAFIKSFQDVVDVFRGVSDKFKFVWDVNEGGSTIDPAKAYPGDHYVDVVGMDTYYNKAYNSADPAKAFQDKVVEPYGLQWQQDFAAAHGKPTAISEWGVQTDDSAPFVKAMADWMSSHHMVYGNYWDSNDAGFAGQLDSGASPNTAAAYLKYFTNQSAGMNFDFFFSNARFDFSQGLSSMIAPDGTVNDLSNVHQINFTDGSIIKSTVYSLVNDIFYLANNKDIWNAHVDANVHYNNNGWHEGRDPNPFFSTIGYLAANADVRAAGINPLTHYDGNGWKEGRDPAADFDNELYLARNPDVKAAGTDPLQHYLQYGQAEGRQAYTAIGKVSDLGTHPGFDAEYYLLSNVDVAKAAIAAGGDSFAFAYQHYETYGWHEGRNPNAVFDVKGYLAAYGDVKAANIDPLTHYDLYGWREGRDPSASFDTKAYESHYTDVAKAGMDPMLHYLQYGGIEGRPSFNDWHFG
ncbi:hypothetical protein MKK64_17525 [Methylobacterium sp. E-025]|uniref:glycoside hydrolase family 26 protein n=1 Tax=Methylobacterium sp. E-025 TaxID=2836561 RepID=UPI001FB8956D|nr:glycosyl hydrolase [Methylobacterium sp. E-025]MCJ2112984.1 hypothetical protein [Methylobacterium sp. E-025]